MFNRVNLPQIMTAVQIRDCSVGFDRIASTCERRAEDLICSHPHQSRRWSQEGKRYRAFADLLRQTPLDKVVKDTQDPVFEIILMTIQVSGILSHTVEIQRVYQTLESLSRLALELLSSGLDLVPLGQILREVRE